MPRRIVTSLISTSLLLCVLACGLWARSYATSDWVTYSIPPQQFRIRTLSGRMEFVIYDNYAGPASWDHWTKKKPFASLLATSDEHFRVLGFAYYTYSAGRKYSERTIVMPLWSVVVLSTLLTVCWFRWRRSKLIL